MSPAAVEHPLLVAAPRMTAADAAKASTVSFVVPDPAREIASAQPHDPHGFQLAHATLRFAAPAGRFSLLDVSRGMITRVRITPQLTYLDLEATLDRVWDLADAVEAAGWTAVQRPEAERLVRELEEEEASEAGIWRAGPWVTDVRVKRAIRRDDEQGRILQLPADVFLITLTVQDDELGA